MDKKLQKKMKQRYSYYMGTAEQFVPDNDEEQAYLFTEFEDIPEGAKNGTSH